MSSIMGREDVDQIVAWLASCRFLLLDRSNRRSIHARILSSASRFQYRPSSRRHQTRSLSCETEARRRVWAAVYFLDRALALNTGRPAVIDDRVCDTQVPSGVMDEDIFPAPKHPPKMPEGVEPPTAYSYTVFRQRIAELEVAFSPPSRIYNIPSMSATSSPSTKTCASCRTICPSTSVRDSPRTASSATSRSTTHTAFSTSTASFFIPKSTRSG